MTDDRADADRSASPAPAAPAAGGAGARLADRHARRREGDRGAGRALPRRPALHPLPLPGQRQPGDRVRTPIRTSFLQRAPGIRNHYRSYLPLFPAAIEEFDLSGFDLVVSSSHCVAKGVIAPPDAFHVCYCHTPMRYAWDQEHAYFPNRTGLKARACARSTLSALRSWDVSSAARVNHLRGQLAFRGAAHPDLLRPAGRGGPSAGRRRVLHPRRRRPGRAGMGTNRGITAWWSRRSPPTRRSRWRWRPARSWGSSCGSSARGRSASGWRGWPARSVHFLGHVVAEELRDLYRGARLLPAAGGRGLRHRLRRGARLRHAGGRGGPRRHPRRGGRRAARSALPGLGGPHRPLRRD